MPRGGKRPGAGRPKGSQTEKTSRIAIELAKEGTSAVELMLSVMRDETLPLATRLDAAKAVAPYTHPRLSAVDMTGSIGVYSHEQALAELEDEQTGRPLQ